MNELAEWPVVGGTPQVIADDNTYSNYLASKVPAILKRLSVCRVVSTAEPKSEFPEWYVKASAIDRQYLKELSSERWRLQDDLNDTLADLQKDINGFAEPLLIQALKEKLNVELDVQATTVRLYVPARLGFGIDTNASRLRQTSLLEAALHNFEAAETQAGAFRDGSGIFTTDAEGALTRHALTIESFASLCRDLDLGAQYQRHLTGLLRPAGPAAKASIEQHFIGTEKAAFNESALIAYLKGDITSHVYRKLQQLRDNQSNITLGNRPLQSHRLSLMGVRLSGIVLFSAVADPSKIKRIYDELVPAHQRIMLEWSRKLNILPGQQFEQFTLLKAFFANGPSGLAGEILRREDIDNQSRLEGTLIAYVPDDPEHPLKQYDSFTDFMKTLTSQLRSSDYQQFFSRFVPQKDKGRFFARVRERFNTFTWHQREPLNMGPWWRQTAVENPTAEPITSVIDGALWPRLGRWRCDKAIADARHIAVPTGDEDADARWKRLTSYLSIGWNVFNFGAMLVPGLGEAMLGIMVGQMLLETMEGIEDWSKGDKEEAAALLTGVMINAAQLAIMAAGHVLPPGAAAVVKPSPFVEQLKPVVLPDGTPRLWNPDLSPYEHQVSLSPDSKPNGRGLHVLGDKEFLSREGKYFAVQDDPLTGQPGMQHPKRLTAYQPKLEHNGAGTWHTELDRPVEWTSTELMRRLGTKVEAFNDATLERIRIASGVEADVLRRLHVENEAPPALLIDEINRFKTWEDTGKLPENGLSQSDNPGVRVLQDAFTQLPSNMAEELLSAADPTDLRVLAESRRIGLHLRQQARAALLELRLARAYEGLFLDLMHAPDTQRLALHSLETLPNWSSDVRIEIREHSFNGDLRDSIGPEDARLRKVLIGTDGSYEARDAENNHLHGADDLFSSVLHALPDAERRALGFEINQGATLKRAVQDAPLARDKLRPMLADNPLRKPAYDPETMKLRGGMFAPQGIQRLTGQLTLRERVRSVRPGWSETEAQAYLDGGGGDITPEQRATALEAEFNRLNANFQRWLDSPTGAFRFSRAGIAEWQSRNSLYRAIRQCWQQTGPRDVDALGNMQGSLLDLANMPLGRHLGTMPPLEGNFQHVTSLNLSGTEIIDTQVAFLDHFPRLRSLNLTGNKVTQFPGAIGRMRGLEELHLGENRIVLDAQGVRSLRGLTRLHSLDLHGNPLGQVPDIGGMRLLHTVLLDETGIHTWPDGLFAQPRFRHFYLSQLRNELTVIPQVTPGSASAELLARTVLNRDPPWLSVENLDTLRDYIRSVGMDPDRPYPPRGVRDSLDWEEGLTRPEWVARQAIWDSVEDEVGSLDFFNKIRQLTQSSHFRNDLPFRKDMTGKLWRMLEAMSKDSELRRNLFVMGKEEATACVDAGAQLFNAMGVEVLIHEAYALGSPSLVEAELVQLARGKSRLDELSRIAHKVVAERLENGEQFRAIDETGGVSGSIDEVEVHLAFMTDLAERLDLPWQSRDLQFRTHTGVTPQMIESAYQRVLDLEAGDLLRDSIIEQPFWASYVRGSNRSAFKILRRRIDATTEFYLALETRATEPDLSLEAKAALKQELRLLAAELGKPDSAIAPGELMTDDTYTSELNQIDSEMKALLESLTQQAMDRAKLQRVEIPFTVETSDTEPDRQ
ncbi:dermonecrotic toxin domain-containing protein [Pseudomonas sp.]|uniref:dermonecrotic toxin domain-containing protein n=1 Tax=Pseudomonas sp. TaxID=306 RepID=UPI003F37DD62